MVVLCLMVGMIVIVLLLLAMVILSLFVAVLDFLIPIMTIISAVFLVASVITLIVLTKKGKFSRESMEQYKLLKYGKARAVLMRIFQVFLWIFSVCSFFTTVGYAVYWIVKPFDDILMKLY